MARSTRFAESICRLKETIRTCVTERGQAILGIAPFGLFKQYLSVQGEKHDVKGFCARSFSISHQTKGFSSATESQ